MPFLLLLFLTLACLHDEWPEPWGPFAAPGRSAALTWGGVALVAGLAWAVSFSTRLRLAGAAGRRDVVRRYNRGRFYHTLGLMTVYALSLYLFGWGWAVQRVTGTGAAEAPGAELLVLAPFFAALVVSWAFFYDAERALHAAEGEAFWGRGAYVLFHARQNLALVFIPILLLVLMKGLRRAVPESDGAWSAAGSLGGLALAVGVYVGFPWILRLVLGLTPLPDSPLRDRLTAAARRLGFRYSDILVWNTRNGVANAMVAGIVPWARYVLLTDRLLVELPPEETEAVFGHEVGHVKHSHMLYYLGFLQASLVILYILWDALAPRLTFLEEAGKSLQALPLVALAGAYIFLVFGFLSRRCERQADVYGCRAVSCADPLCAGHGAATELTPGGRDLCPTGIRTFINVLEKVASLNGISRDRPGWLQSWQHSTIARRVEFLQQVLADPALEGRFQRRVGLVKWGLFAGLAALLVATLALKTHPPAEPATPVAGSLIESPGPHRLGER